MEILLVIICLYIAFMGYFSAKKVDSFVDKINTDDIESPYIYVGKPLPVLILAGSELSEKLCIHLEELNMPYECIDSENDLDQSKPYQYYFALSNDDLKNLTMCLIITKMLHLSNISTICNDKSFKPLYTESGVQTFNRGEVDEFFLISRLLVESR